ncbi:MAG: formylglycine-generating enzyme family protein [Deltaproteobacteria bacterium]|nr:formylglycine-generating enzyme family protein [Deltaproteobacteria bacterium]
MGAGQTIAAGLALTALVEIPGGTYRPLYPADPEQPVVEVAPFLLEAHPVTVGQYATFVRVQPRWAPGVPPAVLADRGYLGAWKVNRPADDRPVTEVSWYAARAYCAAAGRRLPTEDEWELVARASPTQRDASADPAWLAEILAWYSAPATAPLGPVRAGRNNAWGVWDMHGLVWEWVEDFNNALVAGDAREGGEEDKARFCGVGAISAQDVRDYANFMRVAWRSSLRGEMTTRTLGFRCAADLETP